MVAFFFMRKCSNCRRLETRVFTDSWTGLELCIMYLWPIMGNIACDPEDGDNLPDLLELQDA